MRDKLIFTEALCFWLQKKRMTQAELAKKLGANPNVISQYKTGSRTPPMDKLEELASALDVSLPEFFACKDDMTPDIVFVERVSARPRAGVGGMEMDAAHDGMYSFHKSFIERKRGKADDMKIFAVAGDSMEPTLADGDLIMVNLREKDVRTGYVYLLRMGIGEDAEFMVKRLERRPGNTLLIRSDNDRYEDIPVNMAEVDGEIEIFGRMVWSCREY